LPDAPILEVKGLAKSFGAVVAAASLDVTFRRGETVGIIGSNGAGKTSFVNLVTGYLKPDSGTITYLGKDITGIGPRHVTNVGLCRSFQIPQVFGTMSVADNLMMAIGVAEAGLLPVVAPLENARRWDRVAEILQHYGLERYRSSQAAKLPQGVRKLLDIAMATARGPALLMLDEPTSGISAAEKYDLMDIIMAALREHQVTILFIEHDMEIVGRYAERVLAFSAGSIIADGPPSSVLADARVLELVVGKHESERHAKIAAQAPRS
jgi:branched-chain amino acid transport system ATP-binding protein